MVSHWSFSDSKFPGLFSIFWPILITRPLISKSSSPGTNPLMTVPRALFTIGITVTSCSTVFSFLWQDPSTYPSSRLLSILLCDLPVQQSSRLGKFSFFLLLLLLLLTITRFGRQANIRWSVCISKSQNRLYVSFSRTDAGLCI